MILVTGTGGLLGSKILEIQGDFIGSYHTIKPDNKNVIKMDITSKKNVASVMKKTKPEHVIHCAALADVDYCENHEEDAWKVNVWGTKNIVDACKAVGSKIIYISTDFVFDGRKGMYKEDDRPRPINFYSLTKLVGEYLTMQMDDYVICRSSVIYGVGSKKFVQWVIDSLKNNKKIHVAADQFNSPTLNTELAECIIKIIENNLSGIYHTAGSERISRYGFAKNIANVFSLDGTLLEKTTSDKLKQHAIRPKDSSLDSSKVRKELNFKFSGARKGLKKMKAEIEKGV